LFQKFSTIIRWLLVIIGIYLIFQLVSGAYRIISDGSLKDFVWLFAGDLVQDSQQRTNFLLLGTGGENHSGADLTDTFLVISYSHKFGTISILSVPRDFWAEVENGYGMRLNQIYKHKKVNLNDSEAALEFTAETASRITNLPIHYYIKTDFAAFVNLVDAIGGIKILVENDINDYSYPCPDMINYCPFLISAGVQEMDGETALKFARSRKTTSDFDRAARQQKILEAIRQKAFEQEILTNPKKIKEIFELLKEHVETNLRFREIIKLTKITDEFNRQNLAQAVLNDNPNLTGGLLVSPTLEQRTEYYNGAAVLLPVGNNLQKIHALTNVLFNHPRVAVEKLSIEVLNGSNKPQSAKKIVYFLNRYAINALRANNFPNGMSPDTKIYFYDSESEVVQETAKLVQSFVGGEIEEGSLNLKKRGFDLTIILGKDLINYE
jgi:polyisoprenyl-teichoic acid--peptidoglycan teichoic acid transferase